MEEHAASQPAIPDNLAPDQAQQRLPDLGEHVISIMADVERRFAELRQASQFAASEASGLSRREQELRTKAQEVEAQRQIIANRQMEVEAALTSIAQERESIVRQCAELEETRRLLDIDRQGVASERAQLDQRFVDLEHRVTEIEVLKRTLEQQSAELKTRIAATYTDRRTIDQFNEQIRSVRTEAETLRGRLDQEVRDHVQARKSWSDEEDSLRGQIRELGAEAAILKARIRSLEDEANSLEKSAQEFRRESEQARADAAALRKEVDGRIEPGEVFRRDERIEALERELAEEKSRTQAASVSEEELKKRNAAIEELAAHIRKLQSELAEAKRNEAKARKEAVEARICAEEHAHVAVAADSVLSTHSQRLLRRQARLQLARRLLRERIRSAARAREIESHQARTSLELDVQKRSISEARHSLAITEQRMIRAWARSRASIEVFRLGMVTFVVAVISTLAAHQFGPVTYLATATIQAKDRGGLPLTSQQASQWSATHQRMLADDKVLAVTAERLGQRGFESLSDAHAVGAYLKERLSIDEGRAGAIDLRLRCDNPSDGQRILDTFASTLASESNSARMMRADGTVTENPNPAAVDPAPVEDGRTRFGLVLFGSLMGFAAVLWIVFMVKFGKTRGLVPDVSDHEFKASSGDMLGVQNRNA